MGVKLTLYQAIESTLLALSDIEHVGIWNNQFDHEREETPFNYPAVFVEFTTIPWTNTNQSPAANTSVGNVSDEQKAEGTIITLHIGFESLHDVTLGFETIEPIIESIYFAIQGLDVPDANPLRRSNERQDAEHDRVLDWQMDFTTMFNQRGEESITRKKIDAGILTLEITKDLDIESDTVGDIRTGPEQ